ncbi:hypothetical protein ABKV19_000531 [Rosa sericea]
MSRSYLHLAGTFRQAEVGFAEWKDWIPAKYASGVPSATNSGLDSVPQTMQEPISAISSYLCLSLRSRPFLLSSPSHLQTEEGRSSKVLVLSNVTTKIGKNFGELLQKNLAPRLKALLG